MVEHRTRSANKATRPSSRARRRRKVWSEFTPFPRQSLYRPDRVNASLRQTGSLGAARVRNRSGRLRPGLAADSPCSVSHSNLAVRVVTSLVAAPVLLGVLLLAPPLAWYGVVAAACAVAGMELFAMTHGDDRVARTVGVAMTLAVSAAVYFWSDRPRVQLTLLCLLVLGGLFLSVARPGDIPTSAGRLTAAVAGPLYVGVLPTTLALLRRDSGEAGAGYVVLALLMAWLADTGGYFVGRRFGKTPLHPALSPKKTRAGLVGATLGSVAAGLLAHFWFLEGLPLLDALLLGVAGGVIGQAGDLAESLLKRSTGIKDSGSIIPGHGGVLDRIDALLVVAPTLYVYTLWR